jgi:polyketide synthase PksL
MGWVSNELNGVSQRFVDFCQGLPAGAAVLDLGAGFGAATLAALKIGSSVTAVDLEAQHLAELPDHPQLQRMAARFPYDTHFPTGSFAAVHASSLFHFLTPAELESGLHNIHHWLQPGGRLFVHAATPYQKPFVDFLPEYQRRVDQGVPWPGWITKISDFSRHKKISWMPRSIHLLDDRVLAAAVRAAGLTVDWVALFRRDDLPHSLRLDGRESVGLIASRSS